MAKDFPNELVTVTMPVKQWQTIRSTVQQAVKKDDTYELLTALGYVTTALDRAYRKFVGTR